MVKRRSKNGFGFSEVITLMAATAIAAPIGSIIMPSQSNTEPTGSLGRAKLRMGPTTVGPDTTSNAAKRNAK
jgi:hypothetical protein